MRFAFISSSGVSLTFAIRLLAEGHEVRLFIREPNCSAVGDGLVEKSESIDALRRWAGKDDGTIFFHDGNEFGGIADELRKLKKPVLGSGKVNARLEEDRMHAVTIAKMLGIKTPKTVEVKSLTEAQTYLKSRPKDEQHFFKPSDKKAPSSASYGGKDRDDLVEMLEFFKDHYGEMEGIVQQKIDGVCIHTCFWWDGKKILKPLMADLEYKGAGAGDTGPNTGCALTTRWVYQDDEPLIARKIRLSDIEALWLKMDMVPGGYDVNTVVSDRDKWPYFVEFGPRFGWDGDLALLNALTRPLGEALGGLVHGTLSEAPFKKEGYFAGVHLSVAPFPFEESVKEKGSPLGLPIRGIPDLIGAKYAPAHVMWETKRQQLVCATVYGDLGSALGQGATVKECKTQIYKTIDEMRIPHLAYRVDYGDAEEQAMKKLKGEGYQVN